MARARRGRASIWQARPTPTVLGWAQMRRKSPGVRVRPKPNIMNAREAGRRTVIIKWVLIPLGFQEILQFKREN
jgi:hypothetical protein